MAPATPPKPQQKPSIEYARPSLVWSVIATTLPLATPMAPAKMPCISRMTIACFSEVDVPKKQQVNELPSSETKSIARAPCRSAAVA